MAGEYSYLKKGKTARGSGFFLLDNQKAKWKILEILYKIFY
jgi:hypothetical protein